MALRWALFIGLIVAVVMMAGAVQRQRQEAARVIAYALTPAPPGFADQVAAHPGLGVADSALNHRFRVRLMDWRGKGDIRLSRPDWPEVLANKVADAP